MSMIRVSDLTFGYEGSSCDVFEHTTFQIDTDWKLGFIGRNGRGKTTFLNLLMGKYDFQGEIKASVSFEYFPYEVKNKDKTAREVIKEQIGPFSMLEAQMECCMEEQTEEALNRYGELLEEYVGLGGYEIDSSMEKEISVLNLKKEILEQPFCGLSQGEQLKLLLSALFLKENVFLLIDEPTNHLEWEGREVVGKYLKKKSGFILVSHDRYFLDQTIDHVLVIQKNNIVVQKGNFSTWNENKEKQDKFELGQSDRLKSDISHLEVSRQKNAEWSRQGEASKIGNHIPDRGFVGHKAAKMMKRSKTVEKRQERAIEEKKGLLKNIERKEVLQMNPLEFHSKGLVQLKDLVLVYGEKPIFYPVSISVEQGDRIEVVGKNGCGKSSLLKLLSGDKLSYNGNFMIKGGINISYVAQDTSFLEGTVKEFAATCRADETLLKSILAKLDFSEVQFEKNMREFSEGQKKKVLLARSLIQPAHLFIWDEPLNYIDVITRMQLEELILKYRPTLIFVEHDKAFSEKIATKTLELKSLL